MQRDYESLKLFYLGKEKDASGESVPLLYKNKDLTTHAAIIGMTGSGKTGLGISLLEEAAIDNIPSIIIDPKGDMGNLLLTFPDMRGSDFEPWVDEQEAANAGESVSEFAQKTASMWEKGIEGDFQDKARVQRLKESADFTIYTPGSNAGVSVALLKSFKAPSQELMQDNDFFTSHVNAIVRSLLSLIGVESDEVSGKEHIFIASIFMNYFSAGKDMSIEELISLIVTPPFSKVGVFMLEDFYPNDKRLDLAMKINMLVASPSFSSWMQGEALDISNLLFTPEGKARVSIFSIAHLGDKERMFFVSILLNEMVSWMRKQEGTSSLKALLYMDEIAGYFPPTQNPPSKAPMLTLLKQARSFGIGVVLSTQNPIDIDYKGLANIGTWFIGRLQTKQDKERVIDGLSTSESIDKSALMTQISSLAKRQFIMKNSNENGLKVFETRWALSYLKGPITKNDITLLMKDKIAVKDAPSAPTTPRQNSLHVSTQPIISNELEQCYAYKSQSEDYNLQPYLLVSATVNFLNTPKSINAQHEYAYKIYLDGRDEVINFDEKVDFSGQKFDATPRANSSYYELPVFMLDLKSAKNIQKEVNDYLYYNSELIIYKEPTLNLTSKQDESLQDFKIRLKDRLNEQFDAEVEILKEKYEKEEKRLEAKRATLDDKLQKEKSDLTSKATDTIISIGASLIGAFFGKSLMSATNISKAATSVKKVSQLSKEKGDISLVEEDILALNEELETLQTDLQNEIAKLHESDKVKNLSVEEIAIKPKRTDIVKTKISLLWEEI